MLKTQTLIEKLGEEYAPMLKKINIPDFTKCIAQMAGISISSVSDKSIEDYLINWATNKKRFFDLMGDIKVDLPYAYKEETANFETAFKELGIKYPQYYYWFKAFNNLTENKIETSRLSYSTENDIKKIFGTISIEGMSLTHFFKKYLQASDEIVTNLGRKFENDTISATFTISIDPVDMMLASENPYGWTSCYRLENDFFDTHADGCLAAVLDKSSVITYVWNSHGKFNLYNNYEFKDIRYKRMRMWIAISDTMNSIYFNTIYPGKNNYSEELKKSMRAVVESYMARKLQKEDCWVMHPESRVQWFMEYGYNEFMNNTLYCFKGTEKEIIRVYDTSILCPCGCGDNLIPTSGYDECDYQYNGSGLIRENFEDVDREWCDYLGDYCESPYDCNSCPYYNREFAICDEQLQQGNQRYCERYWQAEEEGEDVFDPYSSNIVHCGDHCVGCPFHCHHAEEPVSEE